MRRVFVLLICGSLAAGLTACGGDDNAVKSDQTENYRGYYVVRHKTIYDPKKDSLTMTVRNNRTYSMDFYPAIGTEINFCDHTGIVSNWGLPTSRFSPTDITSSNCDAVRIPIGTFQANWTAEPDSVVFVRETTDSLWRLVLTPR
jgi:hypothetical protein